MLVLVPSGLRACMTITLSPMLSTMPPAGMRAVEGGGTMVSAAGASVCRLSLHRCCCRELCRTRPAKDEVALPECEDEECDED